MGESKGTANPFAGRLIVGLVFAGAALVITHVVSEHGDRGTPPTVGFLIGAAA